MVTHKTYCMSHNRLTCTQGANQDSRVQMAVQNTYLPLPRTLAFEHITCRM
jgi:hypothetical protein